MRLFVENYATCLSISRRSHHQVPPAALLRLLRQRAQHLRQDRRTARRSSRDDCVLPQRPSPVGPHPQHAPPRCLRCLLFSLSPLFSLSKKSVASSRTRRPSNWTVEAEIVHGWSDIRVLNFNLQNLEIRRIRITLALECLRHFACRLALLVERGGVWGGREVEGLGGAGGSHMALQQAINRCGWRLTARGASTRIAGAPASASITASRASITASSAPVTTS